MTIDIHSGHGRRFSWTFGKERTTPTKTPPRRPFPKDKTGGMVANEEMLLGLYHGTHSGLQFASPLAFTPISAPVNMMGLPTPTSTDERTQEVLDEITATMAERIPKLNRSAILLGTAWRWPRFDAKSRALVWEEIPDSIVADILIDIVTGKPSEILTDEQISISTAENAVAIVQRKRRFEQARVTIRWFGQRPADVQDYSGRNIAGILPIPFAHDTDESEIRGHSSLSRIIRDLKDYHDTDYRVSEILTKFLPKQIQEVEQVGKWLENNFGSESFDALSDYDVSGNDLIINRRGEESTSYEYLPEGATSAHEKSLERKYYKIIEGSGIPELFWGPLATGNHASTTEHMQQAISYVDSIRREMNAPYYDLYAASLRILSIARMESYGEFTMGWNRLESVSADIKSQIFSRFSQALSQLSNASVLTKKQLWTLWTLNYPESKPGEFEEFASGLSDMAQFRQFAGMSYAEGQDFGAASPGAV